MNKLILVMALLSGCTVEQRLAMQEEMNVRAQQPDPNSQQLFLIQQQYASQAATPLPGRVVCNQIQCWRIVP